MFVDFCDVCSSFDSVFRRSGKHICKSCIDAGKSFADIKSDEEEDELVTTKEKVKRIPKERLNKVSKILSTSKTYPRKCESIILEFFQKHSTEFFTLNSLWETELNQHYKNKRSLNRDLLKLVNQEKIFIRKQYLKGIRKDSIYAMDKKILEVFADEVPNSSEVILEILDSENYISIKDLSERIGISRNSITKVVKRNLRESRVSVWGVKNSHYYTLNNQFKKEIFQQAFPEAIEVNS
jgi:biotin operon repressor